MAAMVALLYVTAQRRGPAGGDVLEDTALLRRERVAVAVEEGVAMFPEDIGHFETRSRHGRGRLSSDVAASRSSGLSVASRSAAETWV